MEILKRMKKIMILTMVFAAVAVAGTSFALFQGEGAEVREEVSENLRPRGEIQSTEVSGADGGSAQPSCSCCGGPEAGSAASGEQAEKIKAYLKDYYTKALGPGIAVEVKDLGCHHEAEVRQNDRVIKRLSINGGAVTDIT
jgi:hypothetical protein